jgi:hypothetical protein
MKEWSLFIQYGKGYRLQAQLIYESAQIQRIRVSGKNGSIILQNDYPVAKLAKGHKQIRWKLIEGKLKDAQFLYGIMHELERLIEQK